MIEVFKQIDDYPNYEVSNCGRVRSKKRMIRYTHSVTKEEHFREVSEIYLKEQISKRGYKFVQLYKNKKMSNQTIHRLAAKTFLVDSMTKEKCVVNHIDCNKLNNTVENLEWCTDSYNHTHAILNGLKVKGSKIGTSKLNENSIAAIKKMLSEGIAHRKISEWFNVSRPTITLIKNKKIWNHASTSEELTITL